MDWSKISSNSFSWWNPLWRFRILWTSWILWRFRSVNCGSQGSNSLWRCCFFTLNWNWRCFTGIGSRFLVACNAAWWNIILNSLCCSGGWFLLVLNGRWSLCCCSSQLNWCFLKIRLIIKLNWWAAFWRISRIFGLLSCLLALRNFFWRFRFFLCSSRFFAALLSKMGFCFWWSLSFWRLALLSWNLALVVGSIIFLILRKVLFLLHFILLKLHARHHEGIKSRLCLHLLWQLLSHLLWNLVLSLHLCHLVELEYLLLELTDLRMHVVDVWIDWSSLKLLHLRWHLSHHWHLHATKTTHHHWVELLLLLLILK